MKIYIVKDDMRLGPFTLEEVKRQGISADTLVWFKGMPDWKEARAIPELAGAYIPDIPPTAEVDEDDAVEETGIDSAPEPPAETYAPQPQPQPQRYAYTPLPDEGKAKKSKAGIIGIISLLVVMLILCIMVLTKPSKADYIDSITRVTTEYVLDQVGNTPLEMSESASGTVKFATSKAVRAVLEQTLYVEDCLIFNKAKVSVGEHTFTVDGVVPEVVHGLFEGVGLSCRLLFFAFGLWHLGQCNDDQHCHDHEANGYVGVADDCQVVQTDVSLLCFGEEGKDDLSCCVALVGEQMGQHDEGCYCHAT